MAAGADPAATCLVTGASAGIGKAIARELAGRGGGGPVNNAGLGSYGELIDSNHKRQLEQVRVMSEAVVDLSHAFAPEMARRNAGGRPPAPSITRRA